MPLLFGGHNPLPFHEVEHLIGLVNMRDGAGTGFKEHGDHLDSTRLFRPHQILQADVPGEVLWTLRWTRLGEIDPECVHGGTSTPLVLPERYAVGEGSPFCSFLSASDFLGKFPKPCALQ